MDWGRLFQRLRAAGLVLALSALTFKAMLPPGFMLDVSAARVAIALCGDLGAGDLSHDDGAPADLSEHCPFAFAANPVLAAPSPTQTAPLRYALQAGAAPVRPAAGESGAAGPPLPARGPPPLS